MVRQTSKLCLHVCGTLQQALQQEREIGLNFKRNKGKWEFEAKEQGGDPLIGNN